MDRPYQVESVWLTFWWKKSRLQFWRLRNLKTECCYLEKYSWNSPFFTSRITKKFPNVFLKILLYVTLLIETHSGRVKLLHFWVLSCQNCQHFLALCEHQGSDKTKNDVFQPKISHRLKLADSECDGTTRARVFFKKWIERSTEVQFCGLV